jgi:hypothetical protein
MVKLSPLVVENAVEVAPADVVEVEEPVALLVVVDALVVDVEVLITSIVVIVVAVPRMFNERHRVSVYKQALTCNILAVPVIPVLTTPSCFTCRGSRVAIPTTLTVGSYLSGGQAP